MGCTYNDYYLYLKIFMYLIRRVDLNTQKMTKPKPKYVMENINCFKCYEPKLHHENILMVKQNVMKIKKIAKRKKYIE